MKDGVGSKVRERVWVEKFDHAVDPPQMVERIMIENGKRKETILDGDDPISDKASQAPAAPGRGRDETLRRLNPWEAIGLVAEAAETAGIDLQRALKFLALIQMGLQAGPGADRAQ